MLFPTTQQKPIVVNLLAVLLLSVYVLFGGLVFLHFEQSFDELVRRNVTESKVSCIERVLQTNRHLIKLHRDQRLARTVVDVCLTEMSPDPKQQWSFLTASLYGFGILTTLGYGKIEPRTTNGRIFSVLYGFLGIPITMIVFTNFGRYFRSAERVLIRKCCRGKADKDAFEDDSISAVALLVLVLFYLILGASLIPLLNGRFDFFNGIYWAFLCFTAIEYGELIPDNNYFLPIVIFYICVGLAISTIALDTGSMYVRKLHYLGKRLKNLKNVKIWFGAKNLRLKEVLSAVGMNIGLDDAVLGDIDLENLISVAIAVKEGKLSCVPQTLKLIEGIWPPELVPLFLKDGGIFPSFADDDLEKRSRSVSINKRSPSMDNGGGEGSRARSVSVQMKKHSEELVVSDNEDPDEEGLEEGDNISQTSSINYWSRSAMRRGSGEWPLHHRNSQNMIIPPSLVSSTSPIPMINLSDNVYLPIDE